MGSLYIFYPASEPARGLVRQQDSVMEFGLYYAIPRTVATLWTDVCLSVGRVHVSNSLTERRRKSAVFSSKGHNIAVGSCAI